ncbi:MAG: NIPSNAP family protein [Rhodospirillales bacterium]
MPLYELRTYTLQVGKMQQAVELYNTMAVPVVERYRDNLVGYFLGDVGAMNQIIHIWRYEDDAARRDFWARLYAEPEFQAFVGKFRPLVISQENKLMFNAPWGPTP